MLETLVAVSYHVFVGWVIALMVHNLVKTKAWERELLYVIVLIPFALRLLRLK